MLTEQPGPPATSFPLPSGPALVGESASAWVRRSISWPALAAGSLATAAISLVALPREVAYDPWSWLIWGREISHLHLNTRQAATAVKPLAIAFDTLFAPAGSGAPVLWMLVARAASLLALALAFRIAYRLSGTVAGVVAVLSLAVCDQLLSYLFLNGMSEPMAMAAVLGAADSQLQGRRRATLLCLVIAGLVRAEAWPFVFLYCLWLARTARGWCRPALAVLAVGTPAIWFLIDKFGSNQFLRSAGAATRTSQGGPLLSREPGLATIQETWHLMTGPVLLLFLLGAAAALVAWRRTGRAGPALWLSLGAISWLIVDAILAQGRFATGAERYLLPGVGLAAVVAGGFVADTMRALLTLKGSARTARGLAAVAGLAVAAAFVLPVASTVRQVHGGYLRSQNGAALAANLPKAVRLGGGRRALTACGPIATQEFQVPLVAWQLHVTLDDVSEVPGATGTVLQQNGLPRLPSQIAGPYRNLGTVGEGPARWTVLTTCAN